MTAKILQFPTATLVKNKGVSDEQLETSLPLFRATLPNSAYKVLKMVLLETIYEGFESAEVDIDQIAYCTKLKPTQVLWAVEYLTEAGLLFLEGSPSDTFFTVKPNAMAVISNASKQGIR